MRQRLCALLLVLALSLTTLTGCWEEPAPEDGNFIPTESEAEEPAPESKTVLPTDFTLPYASRQTLDPVACPDGMQQVVGSLLYEGLFRLDHQLEPEAVLCGDYRYDPEALTYTFTLRSGAAFSDGSAVTGEDVAATLRRAMTSDRYRARLYQVSSVTASGSVVNVRLSSPNAGLPALLDIPIVKAGTETSLAPIGTGPYCFTLEENGAASLTPNPHWTGGSLPLDRICLSEAADRDTMLYQFTSHDIQLITADLTGADPITATGNISYQDADTTILQYIGFNTQRPPFDQPALRAALAAGIDRSSVISAFLSGHAAAAQSPVSPVSPLYPHSLDVTYSYDAFAAAMARAGYDTGVERTATLLVNEENTFKVSVAKYLAASLSAFDLKIKVQALPWEEYTAALAAGDFDLYYGEVKLTADWDLIRLVGTSGSLNYGGWSNAQTDLLLSQYASATDRAAALEALCAHLRQQTPIVPVCFKSTSVLLQTDVAEDLAPTMTEPFYDISSCVFHLREAS